ncbi:MAG: hypothetical protein CM1200mP10_21890 [Candidatus Neomarinimicrobiota bacterium]|nr:MAG: hypothetical protein CM1200mP10_21890 [Candidatus Neomarinimicrobiota bacterium]
MLIRSISGVRGLVKTDLLPETCAAYAAAVHTMFPDGVIMIGRDTRPQENIYRMQWWKYS